MNTQIRTLLEAATKLNDDSMVEELEKLEQVLNSASAPVMLPLVGEFSSGKTSLINALTDSKALETATKPTTATIFEIHFGAPSIQAKILRDNGLTEDVCDIVALKNENLKDATVVTVFDTSKRISPFTILVDTPGISSPDPKHQQVLMDFLPQADAVLLVIDINQQLTKSLADFLKSASLSGIEVDVVFTKSDTKSDAEVEKAKKYFKDNCDFAIRNVVAVSAKNGNLSELYELLDAIDRRKYEILSMSVKHRIKTITEQILSSIDTLLDASSNTDSLEMEIREQKRNLQKIHHRIERLSEDVSGELEELTRDSIRCFEDKVSSQLSGLINGKSQNYDAEAVSAINAVASAILGDYRQKTMRMLADYSNRTSKDESISLSVLTGIDLSTVGIQGLSYNLDLNNMGHEYDKWIKGGVIAIGAAAAVGAVVATGGGAVAVEGALAMDTAVDIVDTVSDVSSVVSNRKLVSRMESAVKYGSKVTEKYATIDNINESGYGESGVGKGMIDSLVGFISEKTMSKPQRARAIRMYIDGSLSPEFKSQLNQASTTIVSAVKDTLYAAAQATVETLTNQLKSLEMEMKDNQSVAEARKTTLRELKTKIIAL